MILAWGKHKHLEYSISKFLESQLDGVQVYDKFGTLKDISFTVGKQESDDWQLPNVNFFIDSIDSPRAELGSNLREDKYTVIVDIRALDDGMRIDIAAFLSEIINDGFPYFEYTPTGTENASETASGYVGLNFLTNRKVDLGNDVELMDRFRHRISLQLWIDKECL